jgi:hypothetical protein
MAPESADWITWVQRVSTLGFGTTLLLILVGGYYRVWVFGWTYAELKKDRDEWKAIAMQHFGVAKDAVRLSVTQG